MDKAYHSELISFNIKNAHNKRYDDATKSANQIQNTFAKLDNMRIYMKSRTTRFNREF